MKKVAVRKCGCARCREDGPTRELHAELNRFLSTLDETLRAQFLGMESLSASYGGDNDLEQITGVKATAIARARWEQQRRQLGSIYSYNGKLMPVHDTTTYVYDVGQTKSISGKRKR